MAKTRYPYEANHEFTVNVRDIYEQENDVLNGILKAMNLEDSDTFVIDIDYTIDMVDGCKDLDFTSLKIGKTEILGNEYYELRDYLLNSYEFGEVEIRKLHEIDWDMNKADINNNELYW